MLCEDEQTDLNHGVERFAKLTLENLFNLNHIDLTTSSDHSNQSAVLCAGPLSAACQLNIHRVNNM